MTAVALRPVEPTPLARSGPLLETFLSPYTGIVRVLVEFARAPDEARLVGYGAVASDPVPLGGARPTGSSGGSHWLPEAARAAALGEAVERYSAAYVPVERCILATAAELGSAAAPPSTFALFHPEQHAAPGFPFRPFTDASRVRWTRGFSLPDGGEAWLPAQLVYLPVLAPEADEDLIGYATSSGVACAATPEEAILAALFELVERDAFMIVWRNRLSLPRLDWSGDAELTRLDARYFAPSGLRYAAVDLGAFFGIPAALGVVHGNLGELGALGVGAGCGASVDVAWRKALAEAFAVHAHVRDALWERPQLVDDETTEIRTFDDHIFHYGTEERARAAAFLDASPQTRPTTDVPALPGGDVLAQIQEAVHRLRAAGVSAYAVDVTAPDVRESGLFVMRVVCPELCQLDVVDSARFLGGDRLYHAAHRCGLAPHPARLRDLNPDPHPFP
jgi:ribosomal protein S12 methylthiotransferase accessory factor